MANFEDAQYERLLKGRQQHLDNRFRLSQMRNAEKEAEKKRRQAAALAAREEAAQARRDERLNSYDVQGTNQRAGIAADAAYNQQGYTLQRDKQQSIDQLKRDAAQQGYTLQRDERQFSQQMQRDATQQGYTLNRDDRQFGQQMQRDAVQQDYGVQNDDRRFEQQIQRDTMQDTFTNRRDRNQQRDLLQRDQQQFGYQSARDQQQNAYQGQRDERLQGYSEQDANRQFGFQQKRDERLQGFDQQNAVQRETADIRARWMDQVMQQRNNGFEYSPKQQQEMKQMEETFLRQVLNNPELDAGLKQDAMRQYQMKLAGFIPNEKVVDEDAEANGSIRQHKETGILLIKRRGPDGHLEWEPISSSGGGQQQKEDPQVAMQRKATFEREEKFQKIRDKYASKVHPETGEPLYSDDEINKHAMDEFAPTESHYRQQFGLPPQAMYQKEADLERQKIERQGQQRQQKWQGIPDRELPSQYDSARPPEQGTGQQAGGGQSAALQAINTITDKYGGAPPAGSPDEAAFDAAMQIVSSQGVNPPQPQPAAPQPPVQAQPQPAKQKPVTISSTNFDDQLKTVMDSGDRESAAALQILKAINETFKGAPPEDSQEFQDMMRALVFLRDRGMTPSQNRQKSPKPNMFESPRRF